MHLGRVYPYLRDLWACESLFWPGFIPRKLWVLWTFQGTSYWSPMTGFEGASAVGVVSPDRNFVRYDWAELPVGVTTNFVVIGIALAPVKRVTWNVTVDGPAFPSPAGAIGYAPSPWYDPSNNVWPDGPPVGIQPYTPPQLIVRPATWAEV